MIPSKKQSTLPNNFNERTSSSFQKQNLKKFEIHKQEFRYLYLKGWSDSLKKLRNKTFSMKIQRKMRLYLEHEEIPKHGPNTLSQSIKSQKSLKSIFMKFPSKEKKDSQYLLKALNRALKSSKTLESVSLDFGWLNKLTGRSMGLFPRALKYPRFLQSLELRIGHSEEFTGIELKTLCCSLGHLKSLKMLKLILFGLCEKLKIKNGFIGLGKLFGDLSSLQMLDLNLEKSYSFTLTGQEFGPLNQSLRKLSTLKSFRLRLNG